jgi:hypothetical protein
MERMNRSLPEGITLAEYYPVEAAFNPASKIEGVTYEIFYDDDSAAAAAADFISSRPALDKETKGVKKTVLFGDAVRDITAGASSVTVTVSTGENSVRVDQLARQLFGVPAGTGYYPRIIKKGQYIAGKFY